VYLAEISLLHGHYSRFSRRYKRPIVTGSEKFKHGIAVQWNSSPRRNVRPETAVINVEQFAVWRTPFSALRDVSKSGYVLRRNRRSLKWILTILVTLVSFQSYFVRELLAALFFFTILYVILAGLAALYLLIDHVLYCVALWAASLGRSLYFLPHHHLARPTRVPSLPKSRASDGGQELGHA
jgi:hypothetical protein